MGLSLLPTRPKKRFPRASGQGLLPLLGNHPLWKSVFLCWQLQAPVCSDPFQVKFNQSLQTFGGSVLHKLYSLADPDCEQFCTKSGWSAVALQLPPHAAQGMQAGSHPASLIIAHCGEQHPKENKIDPHCSQLLCSGLWQSSGALWTSFRIPHMPRCPILVSANFR